MLRKIFFWLHLSAGALAGVVIFIMSVTGVLLAWQRQIIHWADRDFRHSPTGAQQARVSPETLLAKVVEARGAVPTSLTQRADPAEPVSAEFGRDAVVYLNPWTGDVLGEGSQNVRAFFRGAENWHRWLAAGLESRATARGITGASNLLFLGLLLTGAYLWIPKKWTRQHLRPSLWFRSAKTGLAREWNWHNTIGFWCFLPLFLIVLTGVVMSYPWANDLVYRMTGSEIPTPGGGPGRGGGRGGGGGGRGRADAAIPAGVSLEGLDSLWQQAERQAPEWKSISMRTPASAKAPVQFQIDAGDGGRPDLRAQLTLHRKTGEVVRWEPFSSNIAGRRLRSWIRFSHTGEAGGIPGETIAAIASLGACFLVYTGISLALRRLARAVTRRRATMPAAELAGQGR
ncbi:MAG: PepSY-associated TM helix domain-containing protein [Acidobacteriota bacterium]